MAPQPHAAQVQEAPQPAAGSASHFSRCFPQLVILYDFLALVPIRGICSRCSRSVTPLPDLKLTARRSSCDPEASYADLHRHRRHYLANAAARRSPRPSTSVGGFSLPRRGSELAHKIGILAGDGIGPEVIAEARKALDAAGVALEAVEYDPGRAR